MKYFPYEFRENQEEMYKFIKKYVDDYPICIQAPTGFGKTPITLSSLLEKGRNILWVVRTGTETDRPIEELKKINEKHGTNFLGISFRGKRDMCLLAREKIEDRDLTYDDISFFCQKNIKKCKYKKNLEKFEALPNEPLLYSEILSFSKKENICPYYYQRKIAPFLNLISINYNYIVNENMLWSLKNIFYFSDAYLVVDEAHNLQFTAMNLNSDSISTNSIQRAKDELQMIDDPSSVYNILEKLNLKLSRLLSRKREIILDFDKFIEDLDENEIEKLIRMGEMVRSKRMREGKRPTSSIFHIGDFLEKSISLKDEEGIAFFLRKEKKNIIMERWDMRSSEILQNIWYRFRGNIFISGTIAPVDAFANVIGLKEYKYLEIPSNFNENNVRSIIVDGVSTKGEKISMEMRNKYSTIINTFLEEFSNRNVAIFSASYRIQDSVIDIVKKEFWPRIFVEREGMKGDESREILEKFKKAAYSNKKGILLATAFGRFAEGADFPGKELEALMLVGIPFEKITLKIKTYIDYYENKFGKKIGRYYAYIIPALRRSSQSLGRVIRSSSDKGMFILADERYKNKIYFDLLPDFIKKSSINVKYDEFYKKIKEYERILFV
ncbi:MAG: ATP-dependent DNA helicase [Thermoplasmata archaeon]